MSCSRRPDDQPVHLVDLSGQPDLDGIDAQGLKHPECSERPLESQNTDFHELLSLLRGRRRWGGSPVADRFCFVSDGEWLKKCRSQNMVANGMGPCSSYFAFLQGFPARSSSSGTCFG